MIGAPIAYVARASYSLPVQRMTTVWGKSQDQGSTRGAFPRPLESRSMPPVRDRAERLYSIRKYHRRRCGGFAFGSAWRSSRQEARAAKNACTHPSEGCASSFGLVQSRVRSLGFNQMPLCRTVRQKKTSVFL